MRAREELVERLATRRRAEIGGLSDQGYEELLRAVRQNPEGFVATASDQAFIEVTRALETYEAGLSDDDLLDDDEYLRVRETRLGRLRDACGHALRSDPDCLDARLLELLAQGLEPDPLLEGLLDLEREAGAGPVEDELDVWDNVLLRPRLRLRAALARTCLDSARARAAVRAAESVLAANPTDALGCRHTATVALARLEDEAGFDALDARFSHVGTPWSHLGRTILLYKLNRMPAARRALRGFDSLYPGGAYALLRPVYVELYLPDRPEVPVGSVEQCFQAVREAEPVIADTPDFIRWAESQTWLYQSAEGYAERNDLDW